MQNVVNQHSMDIVDAAHLFAMGELVTTDAGIGCFDSKYFYLGWRPITAIQNADKDSNDKTTANTTWAPLVATPTHPEYPAAHGCLTSAFSDALAAALHTKHLERHRPRRHRAAGRRSRPRASTATSTTSRTRVVNARVWIGFHFRNSAEQGENLGNNVADWALDRYFQPVKH